MCEKIKNFFLNIKEVYKTYVYLLIEKDDYTIEDAYVY